MLIWETGFIFHEINRILKKVLPPFESLSARQNALVVAGFHHTHTLNLQTRMSAKHDPRINP
jgi:hypothetical protein